MISTLLKRKIDSERLANIFVNALIEATESSFADISAMINEDNAFVQSPDVSEELSDHFIFIVLSGNLDFLSKRFEPKVAKDVEYHVIQKLGNIYDSEREEIERILKHYGKFISRVNHPSKNTLYGMSKAVFHKFNLNEYQESYFKSLKTPNPLFLKRMDDLMSNFIWDWDQFFKKYRISPN